MDSPTAPLFPRDPWAPAKGISSRIPPDLPRRKGRRLKPVRWIRRTLVNPRGQVVEVDVPVYPSPTLDTEYAPRPAGARYIARRRAK